MMNGRTTQAETRFRVLDSLRDWATVGTVARKLGVSRSSVEREVASLRALGKLEARRGTFWRNVDVRVGFEYRVDVVECRPSPTVGCTPDERRTEFLGELFQCSHGVEMCEPCTALGRRCPHRCVECSPEQVFAEAG